MTKFYTSLFFLFLPLTYIWSQKIYTATRLEETPILDGQLDDSCWQQIEPTDISLTSTPIFGHPALPSAVRMFYTDDALYVAATFTGTKVRQDGSQRDNTGLADWFSIGLDTWDDDQNAFVFYVTAAGVQSESRVGSNGGTSYWDAVWQSAVTRQADGWSVEIRLPFTALRFPVRGEQHWGLQLSRFDRSSGTLSTWNPRQPEIGDQVLQYGSLEGLQDIHQRQRLSASVYSRAGQVYVNRVDSKQKFGSGAFGVDGRWGFSSNSTLDVALLPTSTINWPDTRISPLAKPVYITWRNNAYLPEPRQLLAEEQPIFEKSNIFVDYPMPRSIQFNQVPTSAYVEKHNNSQVWTAAKFSTRLPGNVGIGVYSTLLGPSNIVFRPIYDVGTGPRQVKRVTGVSNYTLITLEKALANNSWINLTNASMLGHFPIQNNLSSLSFQLRESSNQYQVAGNVQVNIPEMNDTVYHPNSQYRFSVSKVNGSWTWQLSHERTPFISSNILTADPNLYPAHFYSFSTAQLNYRDFTSRGWRQNTIASLQLNKRWHDLYAKFNPLNAGATISVLNQHFQQWSAAIGSELQKKLRSYVFDRNLTLDRSLSPYAYTSLSFRSDDRKRFYYRIAVSGGSNLAGEASSIGSLLTLNWIISPQFRLNTESRLSNSLRATGLITGIPTPGYYLRQFNTLRFDNSLTLNWYCSPTFNLFGQIGYTTEKYQKQRILQVTETNQLVPFEYETERLRHSLSTQIEAGAQWFFAPLSQLRLQVYYYPNYDAFNFLDGSSYYPQEDAKSIQAGLSFIYFLDGNKRK